MNLAPKNKINENSLVSFAELSRTEGIYRYTNTGEGNKTNWYFITVTHADDKNTLSTWQYDEDKNQLMVPDKSWHTIGRHFIKIDKLLSPELV